MPVEAKKTVTGPERVPPSAVFTVTGHYEAIKKVHQALYSPKPVTSNRSVRPKRIKLQTLLAKP